MRHAIDLIRRASAWIKAFAGAASALEHGERLLSVVGAFLGIFAVFALIHAQLGSHAGVLLVGSMGASAVLLFAVPHGPLSQPWPVIGGNVLSALIGTACHHWIADPAIAAPLAVALAIGVMHYLRCLHPPGGATALTAVIGGEAVHRLGFAFALYPVGVSATLLVLLTVLFNAPFPWRRYPLALVRRSVPSPAHAAGAPVLTHEDLAYMP